MPIISLGKSSKNELIINTQTVCKSKRKEKFTEFHHSEKVILNN